MGKNSKEIHYSIKSVLRTACSMSLNYEIIVFEAVSRELLSASWRIEEYRGNFVLQVDMEIISCLLPR